MWFFHKRLSSPQGWELPEGKSLICFAYHWIPGKWHSAWHVLGTFLTIQSKTSISLPFISLRCLTLIVLFQGIHHYLCVCVCVCVYTNMWECLNCVYVYICTNMCLCVYTWFLYLLPVFSSSNVNSKKEETSPPCLLLYPHHIPGT